MTALKDLLANLLGGRSASEPRRESRPSREGDGLHVMSFNVRGSQHPDGKNEWPRRARLNVDCIRGCMPDLIGFQEFQKGNRETYDTGLPGYERLFGPGYENRKPYAFNAIYYDPQRLALLESGGFWLSETPGERSRSWESQQVRSVNWARFRGAPGVEFVHLNTHLDHRSGQARVEGSRLVLRSLDEIAGDAPVLITGDFNCNPGSKTYGIYESAGFADVHRLAGNAPERTFHRFEGEGFKPKKSPPPEGRLDWVLVREGSASGWEVRDCRTVRDGEPPVYPSDHYPVVAELRIS